MPGPYFSGQQPSPCGHYYPDVLRLRDEKRQNGAFVRILDCSYCGRYEVPLDVQTLDTCAPVGHFWNMQFSHHRKPPTRGEGYV